MKCPKCGAELIDDSKFCPYCGEKIEESNNENEKVVVEVQAEESTNNETVNSEVVNQPAKVWVVFEKLGWIFGIVGLVLSFTYVGSYITTELSVVGLVFSILARKHGLDNHTKAGIVLNIIALVVAILMIIIVTAIATVVAIENGALAE